MDGWMDGSLLMFTLWVVLVVAFAFVSGSRETETLGKVDLCAQTQGFWNVRFKRHAGPEFLFLGASFPITAVAGPVLNEAEGSVHPRTVTLHNMWQ